MHIAKTLSLAIAGILVSAGGSQAAPYTGNILLNDYNIQNVSAVGQDGGGGYFAGRNDFNANRLGGGAARHWLPAFGVTPNDISWTMRLPQALSVDRIQMRIAQLNDANQAMIAPGSRVEYTVDPTWTTGWTPLITNITHAASGLGATNYTVTPTVVRGLRWVLPTSAVNPTGSNGPNGWAPALDWMQAYGMNTVQEGRALNIAPIRTTITSSSGWNVSNNPSQLKDQNWTDRALWLSGTPQSTDFVQIKIDQVDSPKLLWLNWEDGGGNDFAPASYDVQISNDGSSWTTLADDKVTATLGTADSYTFSDSVYTQYIRITDIKGATGGNVILREVALYVPEPASLGLLAVGGLALLRRRRA